MHDHERAPARSIAFLNRRAPHGSIHAREALEVVLMGAAFDQRVRLVFVDDGVFQLAAGQDTRALGVKDFARAFRALELYEPERVVAERASLEARGLTAADLLVEVEVLDSEAVAALLEDSDVVLSF